LSIIIQKPKNKFYSLLKDVEIGNEKWWFIKLLLTEKEKVVLYCAVENTMWLASNISETTKNSDITSYLEKIGYEEMLNISNQTKPDSTNNIIINSITTTTVVILRKG